MNSLFPIELQGKGSTEVESLPSYIARSAFQHSVSIGEFLRFVFRNDLDLYTKKTQQIKPHSLVQPNITTRRLVYRLEELTGVDIEGSVLYWMDIVLGRSSEEVIYNFRWCPECFKEMEDLGVDPYIKLKWHMKAYICCPNHLTPFAVGCDSCGCDQISYKRKYPINVCQRCGVSLSKRTTNIKIVDIKKSWEDNGFDIEQLFSDVVEFGVENFVEDGVFKSLDSIFNYCWEAEIENKFYEIVERDKLIAILHRQKRIGLTVARVVALRLGVSLYTFFCGEALKESLIFDAHVLCALPEGYLRAKLRRPLNHDDILDDLNKFFLKAEKPLSLKGVSERLCVSVGYLQYRYPALCSVIVDQYKDHKQHLQLKKIHLAQKLALSYFFDQKYAQYPKSKRQAYKEVRRETGLAKGVIEQAVKRAYGAMYG